NDGLLKDLLDQLDTRTLLTIAIDLTQPNGTTVTRSIGEWRRSIPQLGKRPAVFIIGSAAR
ncbi:MAG TPA: SAM-dependent methyltransferase, partial [Flavobacteriales bacterium]|nr:SAM-dependent methyltransferase [Flavobacteriales bacterium]